jgi:hypothetical protein
MTLKLLPNRFLCTVISLYGEIYSTLHVGHITIASTHNFYVSLNIFDYLLLVTLYYKPLAPGVCCIRSFDGSCSSTITQAIGTGIWPLENFQDIDFDLSLHFILCLRSLHSSSRCSLWNSPIRLSTKSSEPIRLRPFFDTRIGSFDSIQVIFFVDEYIHSSKQFRILRVNSSFSPCYHW